MVEIRRLVADFRKEEDVRVLVVWLDLIVSFSGHGKRSALPSYLALRYRKSWLLAIPIYGASDEVIVMWVPIH